LIDKACLFPDPLFPDTRVLFFSANNRETKKEKKTPIIQQDS
jgi:hypothetical protein